MSTKLDWTENRVVTDEESNVQSPDDNQENHTEETQKKDVCKFYKNGKCRFGKSGKKPDQQGKVCSFSHPQTCKTFEIYGNKEGGCKNKNCANLHLNLCKIFMRHNSCKYNKAKRL